ncbi:hypothetical protein PIB30_056565 [Stylosanthes scabra]|uniref:Carrier domain-containing protein n=1 Tax=Stylosanthes scabra TaxID=79078 RepID=A0ABU6YI96_9FABA|nr:hypothetical protein [Stylosanthes scabra]
MGLIGGLFTSLVSGGSAILFSPMTFIKKPLLWLETMSKYQATHSAGPNFAFELVIRRLESDKDKLRNLDLSSMIFLMVAAEPVRQKTLKRFVELTSPFGLSEKVMAPGYGLAENCVFVSCAFGERKPIIVDWQGRVCCGYTQQENEDIDIRIVDPETCEELQEDGKEGEVWISSPSAGIGYWGREELSQNTFKNKLPNHPGRYYTRTGDLGRIIDGNLFITGRIKDLIIVAGRNIYSADVEKTVETSSELLRPGCCAVIGVPEEILSAKGISMPDGSDQVGLVVIAEVRDGKPVGIDVIEKIRTRVVEEHGVVIASVKLVKPRTISKTTSGKIKRFECIKQFADESLNLVPQGPQTLLKKSLLRSYTTGTCGEGNTPRPRLVRRTLAASKRISKNDIVEFLKGLISEQTGITINNISVTDNLTSYGIDSIGVVKATQKLSDFLGTPVAAIDVFTATNILELANFSDDLLSKTQPQLSSKPTNVPEDETFSTELVEEVSTSKRFGIHLLQLMALIYVSIMLASPAYMCINAFLSFIPSFSISVDGIPWSNYLVSLALAPIAWMLCIAATCICISLFGNSFLRPNYALASEISMYSMDFVKWWALYKVQETSSKVLAVHLRGTVFLKYWFEMLGARIGSSVLLDTVDITDPSLVLIGDEAVIAEGVLVQSHDVKSGILSLRAIKIGKSSSIGPYAVIQKGSVIGEGAEVQALQKVEGGQHVPKSAKLNNVDQNAEVPSIYHFIGIYLVGFLSSLAAAIAYFVYIWFSNKSPSFLHFSFVCICGAFHWIPFTIIAYATMFSDVPSNPITFAISFAGAYLLHGVVLIALSSAFSSLLIMSSTKQNQYRTWLKQQITMSSHLRFAKLLSGTGAFCDNSVVGSQSLILPGSLVQKNVILGALSVAPMNSILQEGGVYIGSQSQPVIRNSMNNSDKNREEMDTECKEKASNLATTLLKKDSEKVTLTRKWYQSFSVLFIQPLMQTLLPYFLVGLSVFAPLDLLVHQKNSMKLSLHWCFPLIWVLSGALAALACVVAKRVLVGKNKSGDKVPIWSIRIIMDSTWQAIRTLIGDFFMDMTNGSYFLVLYMKLMGADVEMDHEVYVDSNGALLNPEMVKIERGGCVGKEALLFGHIYEGEEGGMVKFGEIKIGEDGFVGSRAIAMPGVQLENEGNLGALSIAMKEEIIRSR